MKIDDVLELKINDPEFDPNLTIRGYLKLLLLTLWREEEGFSGKRPFGNSGWASELYIPLIRAGVIRGELDEEGYIDFVDETAGHEIIEQCIERYFYE